MASSADRPDLEEEPDSSPIMKMEPDKEEADMHDGLKTPVSSPKKGRSAVEYTPPKRNTESHTQVLVGVPINVIIRNHKTAKDKPEEVEEIVEDETEEQEADNDVVRHRRTKSYPQLKRKPVVNWGVYYEGDVSSEVSKPLSSKRNSKKRKKTTKTVAYITDNNLGYPLPFEPRCLTKGPFELPYDIWWQSHHNGFQDDFEGKSNFKKIRSLMGIEALAPGDPDVCYCVPESGVGCGENCVNRMMFIECNPALCPCGSACTNQRLLKRQNLSHLLKRHQYPGKGVGIIAKKSLPAGAVAYEYLGEVMTTEAYADKVQNEYKGREHFHCLNLDSGLCIDGGTFGGEGRFVNHSCQPNCHIEKWNVLGTWRIAIVTSRPIVLGEEISYDYNFQSFGEDKVCLCGAPNCRGFMGAKDKSTKPVTKGPDKRKKKKRKRAFIKDPQVAIYEDLEKGLGPRIRRYIRQTRIFLPRNVDRSRKLIVGESKEYDGEMPTSDVNGSASHIKDRNPTNNEDEAGPTVFNQETFQTKLQSLRGGERAVRTRKLVSADENEELDRTARLTVLLEGVHKAISKFIGVDRRNVSKPFVKLPSRTKYPAYYSVIKNPISLSMIEEQLSVGDYRELKAYVSEVNRVFSNAMRANKKKSPIWLDAKFLKEQFARLVNEVRGSVDAIFAASAEKAFQDVDNDALGEDLIRCACNSMIDEGEMVQCSKCRTWQHTWCLRVLDTAAYELCHICGDRSVDLEIPLNFESRPSTSTDDSSTSNQEAQNAAPLSQGEEYTNALNTMKKYRTTVDELKSLISELEVAALTLEQMRHNAQQNFESGKEEIAKIHADIQKSNAIALDRQGQYAEYRRYKLNPSAFQKQQGIDCRDILEEQYRRDILPLSIRGRSLGDKLIQCQALEAQVESSIKLVNAEIMSAGIDLESATEMLEEAETDVLLAGRKDFWTLVVDGKQYRQGDCVYVDKPYDATTFSTEMTKVKRNPKRKKPLTLAEVRNTKHIMRIHSMWRDKDGKPFAYGDVLLRPRDTVQTAARRFYKKELVYTAMKEIFCLESILGSCWVLPPTFYLAGRPKDFTSVDDIWICEFKEQYFPDSQSWKKRSIGSYEELGLSMQPAVFKSFKEPRNEERRFNYQGEEVPDTAASSSSNNKSKIENGNKAGNIEADTVRKGNRSSPSKRHKSTASTEEAAVNDENTNQKNFAQILESLLASGQDISTTASRTGRTITLSSKKPADFSFLLRKK